MKFLVLPVLLSLLSLPAHSAQAEMDLVGVVVDDRGPVKGADVKVVGGGHDVTTSSGEFRIRVPASRVGQKILLNVVKNGWVVVDRGQLSITIPADSVQSPIIVRMSRMILSKKTKPRKQSRSTPSPDADNHESSERSHDKTKILVADFTSIEGTKGAVTETIISKLQNATKKYSDIEIEALGATITAQQGGRAAQDLGRKHKAAIVIWGWYSATRERFEVNAHFEVLSKPKELMLKQDNALHITPIADLETYSIHVRLSDEMSYLTLLTTGLVRFEGGRL